MQSSHIEPSTCLAAVDYITILAASHDWLRKGLKDLGAITFIEACELSIYQQAQSGWDALLDPCRHAFDALNCQGPLWRSDSLPSESSGSAEIRETQASLVRLIVNAK